MIDIFLWMALKKKKKKSLFELRTDFSYTLFH